jgi:transcriptional regulator with XRE-family HTH domain
MDANGMRRRLRAACDRAGSQAAFARQAGVSAELVRLVLIGERKPSDRILDALELERVVTEERYRDKARRIRREKIVDR